MQSRADLLAGIPPPKPAEPKPLRPLLSIRKAKPAARRKGRPAGCRVRPHFRGSKSGFMGVVYVTACPKKPWKAYLRHHGQYVTIGYFPTKEEAARAFNREARRLHGPKAYLNPV